MISEEKMKNIVHEVLLALDAQGSAHVKSTPVSGVVTPELADDDLEDLTAVDMRQELLVPEPHNAEVYKRLKQKTPARVGIWRAGPRPLTRSLLRFRADHAVAQDAVFTDVSDEFIAGMKIPAVQSLCHDKDEFLTRPDLGRKLSPEAKEIILENCPPRKQVQIFIADGLSSTAIETNAEDTYQSLLQGLKSHGLDVGEPFFLKFGRVPAMDAVSELLQPEVTVLLIGERPGLATGESMSCYSAYHACTTMSESARTVISNIHKGGTPAVEAGAHIADVVKKMLEQKTSGLDLQL